MKIFLFIIQKLKIVCISGDNKIIISNEFMAMLCFVLGVYGERFFVYIYSLLEKVSPEQFSFVCLLCTYFCISRFIHN